MYVCLCVDKSIVREKFFALQALCFLLWAFCHPQLRRLGSEDVPVTCMSKDRHTLATTWEQESTVPPPVAPSALDHPQGPCCGRGPCPPWRVSDLGFLPLGGRRILLIFCLNLRKPKFQIHGQWTGMVLSSLLSAPSIWGGLLKPPRPHLYSFSAAASVLGLHSTTYGRGKSC